jgi:hypothetical protein
LENHERNSPLLRQCSLRREKTHNVIAFENRRTSRHLALIFIVCLSFFHPPLAAHAWGTRAHRIAAHIATAYLSSHTRHEVAALINSQSLANIADDADHWRKTRPETSRWHYVNIPFAASAYDSRRDCPEGDCIIAAIAKYRDMIVDRSYQKKIRQEALAFLVHLIADVHQPLHCIDNNDRGGNDVAVMFFNAPTNLHAVWDNELLFRTRLGERAYTDRLMTWLVSRDVRVLQRGTPIDWALAAHQLARAHAYRLPPDSNLQSRYYSDNLPIIEEQLAKAGVRLARVLNEAFRRDDKHQ